MKSKISDETPRSYWLRIKHDKLEGQNIESRVPLDMTTVWGEVALDQNIPICLSCGNQHMDDAVSGFECKRCSIKRIGEAEYLRRFAIVEQYREKYKTKDKAVKELTRKSTGLPF